MDDIIFGIYATDELKLVQHRAIRQGLQHQHALSPADPRPGEPVTLSVWAGVDTSIDHLVCYYTTDTTGPQGDHGVSESSQIAAFAQVETIWDTLNWGYLARWEATLPGQPEGTTVQYRIGGWREGEAEYFADFPDAQHVTEQAAEAYFHHHEFDATRRDPPMPGSDAGTLFVYHVDHYAVPDWGREAIIYQILVDRFYPGDGRAWLQTSNPSQWMGGTLWGIRDKMSYIADLGVNTIWLGPTWESYSAHGYDVIDYMKTAETLGGDAALHAVIEAAHRAHLRVLLDLPCNHCSHELAYFQEALHDPNSRYRHWFSFDDTPIGYRCFFNVRTMPEFNLANPETRDWMVGIARYWLREFDADGYRLDYANGPGPDFWTYLYDGCKTEKSDSFCFGEVVDSPEFQHQYIGRLDGCLDFYLEEQLRQTFGWKTQPVAAFERNTARHRAHFPAGFVQPSFVDNHDMNRFLHIARGDKEALRAALRTQFNLPNPPILYYGTEVGLSHEKSTREAGQEAGRVAMVWDERQDKALLADVTALIHERRAKTTR